MGEALQIFARMGAPSGGPMMGAQPEAQQPVMLPPQMQGQSAMGQMATQAQAPQQQQYPVMQQQAASQPMSMPPVSQAPTTLPVMAQGPQGLSALGNAPSMATPSDHAGYIRDSAAYHGNDPNIAVRTAQHEGLYNRVGDQGSSFGDFQLHYGGVPGTSPGNRGPGLGDEYTRLTHQSARDPAGWRPQIDFAMQQAAKKGWGPFHGARDQGIGDYQGLNYRYAGY